MTDTAQPPAPALPEDKPKPKPKPELASGGALAAAAIVTLALAGIVGLSIWYLARPEPLIIQAMRRCA